MTKFDLILGETENLQFRVAIEPQKVDCFYQHISKSYNIEISYQVVEINSRFQWMYSSDDPKDMVISFFLKDPNEQVLIQMNDRNEFTHLHSVEVDGVYSMCFDNHLSTSTKLVNVIIFTYVKENDPRWSYFDENVTYSSDVYYTETVESIKV
jgi:emp24/gp25L/p24 family/GOLD